VPLRAYSQLWLGGTDVSERFRPQALAGAEGNNAHVIKPDELDQKQRDYTRQLSEIESEQATFQAAWPTEYSRELDLLMERRRTAGDFEGWAVVQAERKRFDESPQVNDPTGDEPSELNVLKAKYRQMLSDQRLLHSRKLVTLCKKYVNDLTDMQKTFMQDGKMDLASAVNAEIRRVKGSPQQQAAEGVLAASTTAGTVESETPPQMLLVGTAEGRVQEVSKQRGDFERELAEVERVASQKVAEWPDKYVAELTELSEQFRREGDYGGWESVHDEMGRFEADRGILQRNIVMQPVKLTELQKKYYLLLEELKRSRAESVVGTTEKYVKSLQELQKKLTVEGQMETAAAVNAEIKRVRSRVDFIEAQNEISPQGPPVPPAIRQMIGPAAGAPGQP